MSETRKESDSLGSMEVPKERYYGAQTARSLKYFDIAFHKMPRELISALILVKKCAVKVNERLSLLDSEKGALILKALELAQHEKHRPDFPLSVWQTGSGTQTNMNVNEVVANIANELAGSPLGSKSPIHPNDHVNLSQSSNDVFPTAMHVATCLAWNRELLPAVRALKDEIHKKVVEFDKIVKVGRTHMMDAVPITLGQEFSGYEEQIKQDLERLQLVLPHLYELPIGGTAVGTGLNAPNNFGPLVAEEIANETGLPFVSAPNKFQALASKDPFVFASGALKTLACSLIKIANDIRIGGSGPRAGIAELILPANEPGSSIMPGKVNPTQCESLTMASVHVIGNDTAITLGATQSNFELNVYMPMILYNILESISLLQGSIRSFTEHLLKGLKANEKQISLHLERSLMLVTALTPRIGYDKAAQVAKLAYEEDLSLKEAALRLGFLNEKEFDSLIAPLLKTNLK